MFNLPRLEVVCVRCRKEKMLLAPTQFSGTAQEFVEGALANGLEYWCPQCFVKVLVVLDQATKAAVIKVMRGHAGGVDELIGGADDELTRLKKKTECRTCNSGHNNILPVLLWNCPMCEEERERAYDWWLGLEVEHRVVPPGKIPDEGGLWYAEVRSNVKHTDFVCAEGPTRLAAIAALHKVVTE